MEPDIPSLGALIGEPVRGKILLALLDGRGLPASELARRAGVTCQTASSHLARVIRVTEFGRRELKQKLGLECPFRGDDHLRFFCRRKWQNRFYRGPHRQEISVCK